MKLALSTAKLAAFLTAALINEETARRQAGIASRFGSATLADKASTWVLHAESIANTYGLDRGEGFRMLRQITAAFLQNTGATLTDSPEGFAIEFTITGYRLMAVNP